METLLTVIHYVIMWLVVVPVFTLFLVYSALNIEPSYRLALVLTNYNLRQSGIFKRAYMETLILPFTSLFVFILHTVGFIFIILSVVVGRNNDSDGR